MKMKKVLIFGILILVCASCGKKQESSTSELAGQRRGSTDPRQDYTKPYLTEDKMVKFIESMKEEHNPFEVVFKEGGQMRGAWEMKGRLEEFNAFARNYGFKDYEDYTAVWGRILVGEMQLWGGDMQKSATEMIEQSIKATQEELKKPNLSTEMRKIYEEQIESSKKSLEDLRKQQPALNESDLSLVKKYKAQIDEAQERYQKKPGGKQ